MNLTRPQLASPEDIFALVQEIMLQQDYDHELDQRICERQPLFQPVVLQFTDAELSPLGNEISAITKDISVGGLGLIAPQAALGPNVIVNFQNNSNSFPILLEIRHCHHIGAFYLMGGQFCADWS